MADRKTTKNGKTSAATAETTEQDSGVTADERAATPEQKQAPETAAAPLDAPELATHVIGNPETSTNFVDANAALWSPPGSQHLRLFDDDGNDVDAESIFEFPPKESPSQMVTVPKRIYHEFSYPGASTPTTKLLYKAGYELPVGQALWVRDAVRALVSARQMQRQTGTKKTA